MIFNIAFDSLVAAADAFTRQLNPQRDTSSDEPVDTSAVVDTTLFQSPQDSERFRTEYPREWMVIASTPPTRLKDHQQDAANEMKGLLAQESELKATQLLYREYRTTLGKDCDDTKAAMEKAILAHKTAMNLYKGNETDDAENNKQLLKIQEKKTVCVKMASLSEFMSPGCDQVGELTRGGLQDLQNKLGLHCIADVVQTVSKIASTFEIARYTAALWVVYWLVNLKINENSSVTNKVKTGKFNHSTATVIMTIAEALGMEGTQEQVIALLDESIADSAPATREEGNKRPAASISVDTGGNPWVGPAEDGDNPTTNCARAYLAKSDSAKKAKKTD